MQVGSRRALDAEAANACAQRRDAVAIASERSVSPTRRLAVAPDEIWDDDVRAIAE